MILKPCSVSAFSKRSIKSLLAFVVSTKNPKVQSEVHKQGLRSSRKLGFGFAQIVSKHKPFQFDLIRIQETISIDVTPFSSPYGQSHLSDCQNRNLQPCNSSSPHTAGVALALAQV